MQDMANLNVTHGTSVTPYGKSTMSHRVPLQAMLLVCMAMFVAHSVWCIGACGDNSTQWAHASWHKNNGESSNNSADIAESRATHAPPALK